MSLGLECLWTGWPVFFILWASLLSRTHSLGESGRFGCGGKKSHGWDLRHSTTDKSSLENNLVWWWSSQRCRINITECKKLQLSKGFTEYLAGYHILLTHNIDPWKCVHRHKCMHAMHVCVCLWTSRPPENNYGWCLFQERRMLLFHSSTEWCCTASFMEIVSQKCSVS